MHIRISPRLVLRWKDLLDRLWFLPSLMTTGASILAFFMVRIDRDLVGPRHPEIDWLFGAGASGARGVLSAIASTMITVTGLTFSITVVTLQLASSQFTPRILRSFTGDRGNQLVLGAFIATFTYSILVLRTVREASDSGGAAFVPSASVTVALVLTAMSVGFLIYFIGHVADSIRASVIINRVTQDALKVIRRELPANEDDAARVDTTVPAPATGVAQIRATAAGYLQEVNDDHLLAVAHKRNVTLSLTVQTGMFIHVGMVIGQLWPSTGVGDDRDELTRQVNAGLITGTERTLHADIEHGVRQLADIGLKALSPGINDPTTATICIDRQAQVLIEISGRSLRPTIRQGKDGHGRLQRPALDWDAIVYAAFNEMRHFAAGDPMVARHLSLTLRRLIDIVPPARVAPLMEIRAAVIAGARRDLHDAGDIARIESAS